MNQKNKLEFSDVEEAKNFEEEVEKKYQERIEEFTQYQLDQTKQEI